MTPLRWGIDVSFGVTIAGHWQEMVDNGLSFAIFRAGQGFGTGDDLDNIRPQCEISIKYNVPFGLYWAIKPWYIVTTQVAKFISSVAGFSAKFLSPDAELYLGATPEQCNQHYYDGYTMTKASTKLPVVNYSAYWAISSHFPAMATWINQDVFWGADYYHYHFAPLTWSDFHHQIAEITMPVYPGYPPLGIYQMAGNWPTPMVPHKIDYNVMREDVYQYLFHDGPRPAYLDAAPDPIKPPVATVAYVVANPIGMGTIIRTTPDWDGASGKTVMNGTPLTVDPTYANDAWVKVVSPVVGYCDKRRVSEVTK